MEVSPFAIDDQVKRQSGRHLRTAKRTGSGLFNADAVISIWKYSKDAVYLVDEKSQLLASNLKGTQLIDNSTAVRMDIAGNLILLGGKPVSQLLQASNIRAKHPCQRNPCFQSHIETRSGKTEGRFLIEIFSLVEEATSAPSIAYYLIVVIDVFTKNHVSADGVASLFELTNSEKNILQELVNGKSLAHIAQDRGTTYETVRGQLKIILCKTGAPSQLDLLRLCFASTWESVTTDPGAKRLRTGSVDRI